MRVAMYILLFAFLAGCQSAGQILPEQREIRNQVTVNKSFDSVWGSAIEWFALNNTALERIEKDNGLISTERNLLVRDEMDCGEPTGQISYASAKIENVRANANVVFREISSDSTRITVSLFGGGMITIRNAYGQVVSSTEAVCVSTGLFEADFIEYLENI